MLLTWERFHEYALHFGRLVAPELSESGLPFYLVSADVLPEHLRGGRHNFGYTSVFLGSVLKPYLASWDGPGPAAVVCFNRIRERCGDQRLFERLLAVLAHELAHIAVDRHVEILFSLPPPTQEEIAKTTKDVGELDIMSHEEIKCSHGSRFRKACELLWLRSATVAHNWLPLDWIVVDGDVAEIEVLNSWSGIDLMQPIGTLLADGKPVLLPAAAAATTGEA